MKLSELYKQIKNPLDEEDVINKLIIAYSNRSNVMGGFYGSLVKTVEKEYENVRYNKQDSDYFYSMLFNKWKNSIVSISRERFNELKSRNSYNDDFIAMRNYLKTVPDVTTKKEADKILSGENLPTEISDAIDKYRWTAFGEGSGWVHVSSRHLTAKKDDYVNVEHRLYLDTESLDTYKMARYFIEKCEKYKLPYYFKYDEYGQRDDTIVIYSSTENLTNYVEILKEIKREHPDLISRTKNPPLLTGKIDDWIGYGSEPKRSPNGDLHSFNDIRSKAIEPAFDKTFHKWIRNNINLPLKYNNEKINLEEYIARKATSKLYNNLKKSYECVDEYERKSSQKKGRKYNPNKALEVLGYSKEELQSKEFINNMYLMIKNYISYALPLVCSPNKKEIDTLKINVRNNHKIYFGSRDLDNVLAELAPQIVKINPNIINELKNNIIINSRQYGINTEKYCFDLHAIERMKEFERLQNRQEQLKKQSQETTQNQKQNNENIDLNKINVSSIISIINPELLNRNLKLPNGAKIPAIQYIQELVFPLMPENGIVILKNNNGISVKDFIEQNVIIDCQRRYNGDLPKYMINETKQNAGQIDFINNGEKLKINPVNVTNYLNPDLLKRKLRLPNGAEISATQYIQEVYSPHIPRNGKVILRNNQEISVKDFIEQIILKEGQTKYNGDINLILYYTTKNNKNVINQNPQHISQMVYEIMNDVEDTKNNNNNHNYSIKY